MPPSRDRLYVGGRFRSVNGAGGTDRLVALRTQDGRINSGFARQPGRDVFDILADSRGRVWLALDDAGGRAELLNGSGGLLRGWDIDGDVQTIERIGDRVFFGGHNLVPDDRSVATVSYDAPGGLGRVDVPAGCQRWLRRVGVARRRRPPLGRRPEPHPLHRLRPLRRPLSSVGEAGPIWFWWQPCVVENTSLPPERWWSGSGGSPVSWRTRRCHQNGGVLERAS